MKRLKHPVTLLVIFVLVMFALIANGISISTEADAAGNPVGTYDLECVYRGKTLMGAAPGIVCYRLDTRNGALTKVK